MSKLRTVYFENFEGLYATADDAVSIVGSSSDSGWKLKSGNPYAAISTVAPIEGNVSVRFQGEQSSDWAIECVVRETSDGPITAYELRWRHKNYATAYPVATNRPFKMWVANVDGDFPWKVEIHKNSVKVEDNAGLSATLLDPSTTAHDYRLTDDGAGNIELFVDAVSEHTGTAIAIAPTDIDRVVAFQEQDPANTSYDIYTGQIDLVNLIQVVASTYNVARVFIGK